MNKSQQAKFNALYQAHVDALIRQGKAPATIDGYSRAVRRISEFFDCLPTNLTEEQLKRYFTELIKTHSWSTVKIDRNGLQFFYTHVLKKAWRWIDIVKPPQKKVLPDILSRQHIEALINQTREIRYQTFILTSYSMGLRLGETLNLQVGDIDSERMKVHIRAGKGQKDRLVTLPERTLRALRRYWCTHKNPNLIFPNGKAPEQQRQTTQPMDRGGLQKSFKAIVTSAKIKKRITIHSLRHCYGAHLTESGVPLRAIQHEMGHECPKTTAIYTQLTETTEKNSTVAINALIDGLKLQLESESRS